MTQIIELLASGERTAKELSRLLGMALEAVYEVLVHLEAIHKVKVLVFNKPGLMPERFWVIA